jgi:uncharacterized protein (DUF885 family)
MSSAHDAMKRYTEALSAMPTSKRFAIGPARTREYLDARGIELGRDELRAVAASFVARNREEVESLRRSLVAKYGLAKDTSAAKLRDELDRRYAVPGDRVLEIYAEESARITAFIRERDLFPIPPGQTIDIIPTPKFLRGVIPAGAMMPPPPFREGVRKSVVFLTLGSASIRHTLLSIPMMLIHECIPGHHLQLSTASITGSVIRRHVDALEHGEGWTTMLEDYMLDVGYGVDLADEMRFVAKREIARIGPRVAIDLYFMTGDPLDLDIGIDVEIASEDPFANAASLLAATTDFSPERIRGELNWYSQKRGVPLSYLAGNDLVWRLRRDVRARRGDPHEADRDFHRAYLESGNMPVSRLRSLLAHRGMI